MTAGRRKRKENQPSPILSPFPSSRSLNRLWKRRRKDLAVGTVRRRKEDNPPLTRKFSFPRLIVSCFLVMAVGEREMIRQMKAVYHSASILSNLPLPHGLSLSLGRG